MCGVILVLMRRLILLKKQLIQKSIQQQSILYIMYMWILHIDSVGSVDEANFDPADTEP